jgi:hypothetical protein
MRLVHFMLRNYSRLNCLYKLGLSSGFFPGTHSLIIEHGLNRNTAQTKRVFTVARRYWLKFERRLAGDGGFSRRRPIDRKLAGTVKSASLTRLSLLTDSAAFQPPPAGSGRSGGLCRRRFRGIYVTVSRPEKSNDKSESDDDDPMRRRRRRRRMPLPAGRPVDRR